jgi:hypothetical protein
MTVGILRLLVFGGVFAWLRQDTVTSGNRHCGEQERHVDERLPEQYFF